MMNLIAGYKQHYKALIFLGLPIVIGQLGVIILGFADTLMIGHHSTEELGAASFVNNVFTLCIIFSTGFSYGLTPIVGSLYGNRRFAEAGQALRCSLVANVLVALLLTFVMTVVYFNVERLGQPEELIPLIKPYYLVLLASLVFVMLFNGFKQFTDGITDTKTAMWILLGGNALNIVGNYILINGKLGFPELGLLGAGISTLFSRIALVASLFFPFLIYQFGDGLQINFANALRGISDVKPMMIIAFISYFIISLPVGYFCGFVLGWGLVGVWMAFPFGLTSAGLMLWLRFRYKTAR